MIKPGLVLLCLGTLAAPSQGQLFVTSYRDVEFANTTGTGSPRIPARVQYPATSAGIGRPVLPNREGHSLVVFMHGHGVLGRKYTEFADRLSERGYVVVLGDTALRDEQLQLQDTRALYSALAAANGNSRHFLYGALDMQNVGLAGHSMGGKNAFRMFADNPGYSAVMSIAPAYAGPTILPLIDVPFGVIHGEGDPVVHWLYNGQANYVGPQNFDDFKFFYHFDTTADHHNVIGMERQLPLQPIWGRSASVIVAFFDRTLRNRYNALERVVGQAARNEPRLVQLDIDVQSPDLWFDKVGVLGGTSRFEMLATPGPAALFSGIATAPVSTPYGLLELVPATIALVTHGLTKHSRMFSWRWRIPNDPALVGSRIPLQGLGLDNTGQSAWTNMTVFSIQ